MQITRAEHRERAKRAAEWRNFRRAFFLTQRQLASALGIGRTTVQSVEAQFVTPTLTVLRKFHYLKLTRVQERLSEEERVRRTALWNNIEVNTARAAEGDPDDPVAHLFRNAG